MKRTSLFRALLIVACFACAACSSKPSVPTTPIAPAPTAGAEVTGVTLELGELTLIDVSTNQAVRVRANGDIEYPGVSERAKLTPDGRIVKSDSGETAFTLLADGSIAGPDGKLLDMKLSADGVVTIGDKTISVNDDGSLAGVDPGAPQMKIEGATTPGLERTAMFVLIALTTPAAEPPPPSPPAE